MKLEPTIKLSLDNLPSGFFFFQNIESARNPALNWTMSHILR
jgi:hypothetical protein